MTRIQLARLEKDTVELKSYIQEVLSQGNKHLAVKLEKKLNYLESRIAERMAA
jgi:hypothetical protein